MEGLCVFVVLLLGVQSSNQESSLGSEVTVRPGDNVTLYCDLKLHKGELIVWYRNCSHENQPSLVLTVKRVHSINLLESRRPLPHFQFVYNQSSKSYDLLIVNITVSDEGLYYCGSEKKTVEENKFITERFIYKHRNITTKIKIGSIEPHQVPQSIPQNCDICWKLLFSMCPLFASLSSFLSFLLGFYLCGKNANQPQQIPDRGSHQTRVNQEEEVCYAPLEICQASQRPHKKTSDTCTYSATVYNLKT